MEKTDCPLVMESATEIFHDSDAPASLPGYKTKAGGCFAGLAGFCEAWEGREFVEERRDASAAFRRRWKLDNLPSCTLQVWDFRTGGSSLRELSWLS